VNIMVALLASSVPVAPVSPVADFEAWARDQGTPVESPACHVPGAGPITCYGLAEGSSVIVGVAVLDEQGNVSNFKAVPLSAPAAPAATTSPNTTAVAPTTATPTPTTVAPATAAPTTAAPTTTVPGSDPLLPVEVGADGPVVAAIQGRLGVSVDCDFGDQTRRAVEEWQETAGIPVTGTIDEVAWQLLDVPTTWGDDVNGDGKIEPSEVSLVCDGAVELPPPPVDTTGWPDTVLARVAEACSVPDEYTYPNDEGPDVRYSPDEDTITIIEADANDYPQRGDEVFDTMICVLGLSGVPDRVISQISSTRALDGMQFAEWDGMAAQWNFHPDSGMNLTIYSTS
jgi:peptidoglycan hydrolase-like protein with peptidoglycan-binding domain